MKYIIKRSDGRYIDHDSPCLGVCELSAVGHPTKESALASLRRRWGSGVEVKEVG